MSDIAIIVSITAIIELIELSIFYSADIQHSILKSYNIYKKSPFLLFFAHIGYIWIILLSLAYSNLAIGIILAIALKTLDIFTKIELIKAVYINKNIDSNYQELLNVKVPFWVYIISLAIYPYFIYLAFS